MTEIPFDKTELNQTYICPECGVSISDQEATLPNQKLHRGWHNKLEKSIKMSSLGFGPMSIGF